jgi:hypothetical protein
MGITSEGVAALSGFYRQRPFDTSDAGDEPCHRGQIDRRVDFCTRCPAVRMSAATSGAGHRGPFDVAGTRPGLVACKVNWIPPAVTVRPEKVATP